MYMATHYLLCSALQRKATQGHWIVGIFSSNQSECNWETGLERCKLKAMQLQLLYECKTSLLRRQQAQTLPRWSSTTDLDFIFVVNSEILEMHILRGKKHKLRQVWNCDKLRKWNIYPKCILFLPWCYMILPYYLLSIYIFCLIYRLWRLFFFNLFPICRFIDPNLAEKINKYGGIFFFKLNSTEFFFSRSAPPTDKIYPFSKTAVTFERLLGFWCPLVFRKFLITMTYDIWL